MGKYFNVIDRRGFYVYCYRSICATLQQILGSKMIYLYLLFWFIAAGIVVIASAALESHRDEYRQIPCRGSEGVVPHKTEGRPVAQAETSRVKD